ncbi:MAG: phenylacetate-CoA oxygenase subunit PaaJ [Saprospiraceae bacterium]|nr:phenylacetate-CoA oxygenase subunit PaaJ [Saprospiraceae bacterium]
MIELLSQIKDPEIPVLNIVELGILRKAEFIQSVWQITITPTYIGCPAMGLIEMQIKQLLDQYNFNYKIITVISPSWTTNWMTEPAKQKLKQYGIAPPLVQKRIQGLFENPGVVPCPQCNSEHTVLISEFASTACKALYKCKECLEPFDYFKCH